MLSHAAYAPLFSLFALAVAIQGIQETSGIQGFQGGSRLARVASAENGTAAPAEGSNRLARAASAENATAVPTVLLWNSLFGQSRWNFATASAPFEHCTKPSARRCQVTTDRSQRSHSAAVVMHGRDPLDNLPLERPAGQKYVYFVAESPEHLYVNDVKAFDRAGIDWIANYRLDSDLHAPYGRVLAIEDDGPSNHDPHSLVQSQGQAASFAFAVRKPALALRVASNCNTNDDREDFVGSLQGAGLDVNVLGACGRPDPCPRGDEACNVRAMNEYKFVLAFENSRCKGYITEKFWEAMKSDAVPVVLGASRAEYEAVAPPGSFVHVEDFNNNAPRLAAFLNHLASDEAAHARYKAWKTTHRVDTSGNLMGWFCQLCDRLVETAESAKAKTAEAAPAEPAAEQLASEFPLKHLSSWGGGHRSLMEFFFHDTCSMEDKELEPFYGWRQEQLSRRPVAAIEVQADGTVS